MFQRLYTPRLLALRRVPLAAILAAGTIPLGCAAQSQSPAPAQAILGGDAAGRTAAEAPSFAPPQPSLSDLTLPEPVTARLSPAAKSAASEGIEAMGKNKFEDAEAAFEKLLKLSPNNISGLVNLGLVEFRLGKMDDAQRYFQQAIRIKPEAGLAWMMSGVISERQGQHEAATAALAQAVYLEPKSPQAHNYFAATMAARGWYSGAEDELQAAIRLAPNFGEAHYNLAVVYLQRVPPSVELARRHYQKALELGEQPDAELAAKLDAAPEEKVTP